MAATQTRGRLEDRRSQVVQDLSELNEQAAADEVEPRTAQRLRGVYTAELAEIDEHLAQLDTSRDPSPGAATARTGDDPTTGDATRPKGTRRGPGIPMVASLGLAALLAVITGLILWAGSASGPEVSADDGGQAGQTVPASAIDIDALTTEELEASLNAFPESGVVRLALADRYLSEGDQKSALGHYLMVAESDAPPQQRSRALARIGYLSYATGQYEQARTALLESLALNESNTEAFLYLGYVLLNGLDDPSGAMASFEHVLADPSMPGEVVESVHQLIAEARRAGG